MDSDDEGSQAIDAHESFRDIVTSHNNVKDTPSLTTNFDKRKTFPVDHRNFRDNYSANEGDDDDTPVFKSRRR